MNGRRLVCALTVATLAALSIVPPAVASSAPVLCPTVRVTPTPSRPPKPKPPPDVPEFKAVGGVELASPGLVVPAGASRPPAITASSWVVADLDTGAVLGACGAHEYGTPASVQKLLLAATMIPRLDPKQRVRVTREDLNFEAGSSAVGLLLGGVYPVDLLWLGLLLPSGNDAANVLARLGGGGEGAAGGVRAMNDEARRLGAYQTRAVTPSGLDGPGQFTSAYDLALIARVCFALPAFKRYTLTERVQVPRQPGATPPDPRGFQIQNENRLIFEYPGALGGKTGFTSLARHTYVGAAERGGRRLAVTLLGAEARPLRGWQQGAALLDWGFAQPAGAQVGRLVEPGEVTPTPTPSATPAQASSPATTDPIAQASHTSGEADRGPFLIAGVAAAVVLALVVGLWAARRRR